MLVNGSIRLPLIARFSGGIGAKKQISAMRMIWITRKLIPKPANYLIRRHSPARDQNEQIVLNLSQLENILIR